MSESRPISPTMVSPPPPEAIGELPHFSERMSWRMTASLVWMLLLAVAGGGLWFYGQDFLNAESLEAVWYEAFPVLMLAGPMALIMLAGGLDLSIGAVMALASVVTAVALADGQSPDDAFGMAMMFAGGIGLLHALLAGLLTINATVLTLITAIIIHQYAIDYASDLNQIPFGDSPGFIGTLYCSLPLLGISAGISMVLIQLAQIGGQSGRLPIARQKWYRRILFISLPYVLSSLAAGVVGSSMAGYSSRGSTNANQGTVLMVIFAAIVGGNCTGRRFGTVIGAVAGAAILMVFRYILVMKPISPATTSIMTIAITALAAMLLSHLIYAFINRRYRKSREKIAS
ncbi:MAG: ABC transporter permease [bacterium]|nr:ABC transporter permease [bacterium]